MMQLSGDEIFKYFTSPAFDLSSAVMVSSIIRQLVSNENSAEISPAVSQQQSVTLTLCQTLKSPGVMASLTIFVGKSGHHVFVTFKLMLGVSMSMTLFSQGSVTTLSLSMTFTIILLVNVDLVVSVVNNPYNNKGLNIIMKFLKSIFQYSLFDCAHFFEELKLLNDYFEDYKTDAGFNENVLN